MALSDLTFKLYTDSGLISLFGGTYELLHQSNFSDNPQDFVLYFGSNTAGRVLKATSDPGVDEVTITPTYALPDWAVATVYALGYSISPNGYRYEATTGGTSHASTEPTWPTTIGSTVVDNTVTWTCVAEKRDTDEITLGLSSGDLDTNIAGAALDLGTEVESGVGNAIAIHIRVENAIPTVSSTIGQPELTINIVEVQEEAV